MEDFIYILLGIVWVVFSIIKGTNKKRAAQYEQDEESTTESGGPLQEWLEEFLPPPAQKPRVEETYYPTYDDEVTAVEEYKTAEQSPYVFYDGTLEDVNPEIVSLEEMEEISPVLYNDEKNEITEMNTYSPAEEQKNFNLRRAIVYQAVLERPYI